MAYVCWNSSSAYYRLTARAGSSRISHCAFPTGAFIACLHGSLSLLFICTQRDRSTLYNGTTLSCHPVGHYESSLWN